MNTYTEPHVDFDYDAIKLFDDKSDRGSPLVSEMTEASPKNQSDAEILSKILYRIVIMGAVNPEQTMIWINVFLFSMGIHPNQGESGEKICNSLGVGKAEWFRRVSRMKRILNARGLFLPKIAGEWSKAGRKSAASSAKKFWKKNGGKPMMQIPAATQKLNWIAEWLERLDFSKMNTAQSGELKIKLRPVVEIYNKL